MSVLAVSLWHGVSDFLFNPNLETKILVTSNYITPAICLIYFVGITYVGPYLMKNRSPFNIQHLVLFYNFALVALNFHIAYGFINAAITVEDIFVQSICPADGKTITKKGLKDLGVYPWLFFLSKFLELVDSVFFILRKRFNLLTALHRLHHALTPAAIWYILQVDLNFCLYIGVTLNALVHVVMYFYYGLAACGPSFRKHLWWKKYLTAFQIIQIVSVILCVLISAGTGCYTVKTGEIILLLLCTLVLVLFVNYFIRQYSVPGSNFIPTFGPNI